MVFVGYNENGSRGFKVWDPLTKKVKIRHSLLFEEGSNIGFGVDPSRKPATAIADESTDGEEASAEPQEPRLAIDQESKSSGEQSGTDEGDDGWSGIYVLTDDETLEDVGLKLGIDPEEIQRRNGDVAGCNPRTGLIPIDSPKCKAAPRSGCPAKDPIRNPPTTREPWRWNQMDPRRTRTQPTTEHRGRGGFEQDVVERRWFYPKTRRMATERNQRRKSWASLYARARKTSLTV